MSGQKGVRTVAKKGGAVPGASEADVSWATTVRTSDKPVPRAVLPDRVDLRGRLGATTPTLRATTRFTSARTSTVPSAVSTKTSTLRLTASLRASAGFVTYGRTGATPDTNPGGDAYVDNGSSGTNFGAATGLLVSRGALGGEQRALIEFDLTRFTNFTAVTGGFHQFTWFASHDAAVGSNDLRVRFSRMASRPFTESTVTWDNQPAEGTLVVSTAVAVSAGAAQLYAVSFTDAQVNDMLGQWVYVRFLSEATLPTTRFDVRSREAAVADRWQLSSLELKR